MSPQVKLIGKQFRGGRQEDAHEFLIHFLDAMQVEDGSGGGGGGGVIMMMIIIIILVTKPICRRPACGFLELPPPLVSPEPP